MVHCGSFHHAGTSISGLSITDTYRKTMITDQGDIVECCLTVHSLWAVLQNLTLRFTGGPVDSMMIETCVDEAISLFLWCLLDDDVSFTVHAEGVLKRASAVMCRSAALRDDLVSFFLGEGISAAEA